jgi:indole-3-glycerol phosphate synthase
MSFLKEIVEIKKEEIKALKSQEKNFSDALQTAEAGKFLKSITRDPINIIAEIKKASPTMGVIRKEVNIENIAKIYEENGANAISVLTDKKFFQGQPDYLAKVKNVVQIPVMRKDFILDPLQIQEARYYGADAILLIATILPLKKLKELISVTRELGMDFILEVHDEEDLKKALKTDAQIIGINNRDLRTFQINLNTALKLYNKIPEDRSIVVESGLNSLRDLHFFTEIGVKTFLVGKYLMEQNHPGNVLRAMKDSGVEEG